MRNSVKTMALLVALGAFVSIAAPHRAPKTIVADPSKAKLTAFSGSVNAKGKVDLKVCFDMDPAPKVECVRVDGSALVPMLTGAPLEAWKDKNGF